MLKLVPAMRILIASLITVQDNTMLKLSDGSFSAVASLITVRITQCSNSYKYTYPVSIV